MSARVVLSAWPGYTAGYTSRLSRLAVAATVLARESRTAHTNHSGDECILAQYITCHSQFSILFDHDKACCAAGVLQQLLFPEHSVQPPS
jgi:hypothetical protein